MCNLLCPFLLISAVFLNNFYLLLKVPTKASNLNFESVLNDRLHPISDPSTVGLGSFRSSCWAFQHLFFGPISQKVP